MKASPRLPSRPDLPRRLISWSRLEDEEATLTMSSASRKISLPSGLVFNFFFLHQIRMPTSCAHGPETFTLGTPPDSSPQSQKIGGFTPSALVSIPRKGNSLFLTLFFLHQRNPISTDRYDRIPGTWETHLRDQQSWRQSPQKNHRQPLQPLAGRIQPIGGLRSAPSSQVGLPFLG